MTRAHSIFIIVLVIANIGGALWLLWWTSRTRGDDGKGLTTTGHVWDEDLHELNNPLPRWWLWLFIITVLFGGIYLLLYPGLGSYEGTLKWSARAEHAEQSRANAARVEQALAPFAGRSVDELMGNTGAITLGRNLFLNNCAACHGSDGGGAPGFPNLTDGDWLWGGDADTVVATIADGRVGVMPAWGDALGARGVEDMLEYVFSLQGRTLKVADAHAGKVRFSQMCAACHGADGRGNPLMGAPNLTDGIWLHGGAIATVRETIEKGRNGAMPAHAARLGATRVKLLAAYVLSLRQPAPRAVAAADDGSVAAAPR
jgi:cytochrome c oxidase cbb3-type subunit 3